MEDTVTYPCEVREVFSGDDLIVLVDLGFEGLYKRQRVRLHGVDTPNAVGAGNDTEAGRIRKEVRSLTRGRKAQLTIISRNSNSWVVALVVEADPEVGGTINLNEYLREKGYIFPAKR